MSGVSLHNVRLLTLREIAELWAPQANIPESVMLRELRYAVINIPRLRNGEGLFDMPPPDEELPDPDERVDRQWLMEFCSKQENWPEPQFWFGRQPQRKGTVGRPSYMPEIIEELRARAEQGRLAATVAEQARQLVEWVEAAFPNTQTPKPRGTENGIRDEFKRLKAGGSDQ